MSSRLDALEQTMRNIEIELIELKCLEFQEQQQIIEKRGVEEVIREIASIDPQTFVEICSKVGIV